MRKNSVKKINPAICVMMENDYKKNEPDTIQKMFGSIASQYDFTNGILSFQIHRYWNSKLLKNTLQTPPATLLDLCAGTGEIGYTWLKKEKTPRTVYFVDFCQEMLDVAEKRKKPSEHILHYIQGDAQAIPLPSHSVDAVVVAYGIRNVKNPPLCFEEVHRVLKPGGQFGILELTEPKNALLRSLHRFYLTKALPVLGGWITSNKAAYKYLSTSIQTFVKPKELASQLEKAGFQTPTLHPLTGGIAHIITATKKA